MRILCATSNPHKLREMQQILEPLGIELFGLGADAGFAAPEETGQTFQENARIKAVAYACATRQLCLAEDSGLCVDALDGAPGVRSARYAEVLGPRADVDAENNAKLLAAMREVPSGRRGARFVAALCLADADGRVLAETTGTCEGEIAEAPRGKNGFGYDPLLYLRDLGVTSAELPAAEKHERSHRGKAARAMAELLRMHTPRSTGG